MKKGQISTTIMWMLVSVGIVFVLILFLSVTFSLAGKQRVGTFVSENVNNIFGIRDSSVAPDPSFIESYVSFLQKPLGEERVIDLISSDLEEGEDTFVHFSTLADSFLDTHASTMQFYRRSAIEIYTVEELERVRRANEKPHLSSLVFHHEYEPYWASHISASSVNTRVFTCGPSSYVFDLFIPPYKILRLCYE